LLAGRPLLAQTFVLEAFTVGGGGGTSSGGSYTVSGTVGQPDVGQSAGGDYRVGGGFWAVVSETVVPGSLELTIRLLSNGTLQICWPSTAAGRALEETASLSTPAWGPSTLGPDDDGNNQCLTVPATVESRFFRLAR
jgi:hypothetical protein